MEAQRPAEQPQAESTGGGSSGDASVLLHPYLWPALPLKTPTGSRAKPLAKQLNAQLVKNAAKEGEAFLRELDAARSALTTGGAAR